MDYSEILRRLRSFSNPIAVAEMARFGIHETKAYGVSTPVLRKLAKQIGKDHQLAQQLWSSGILDARALASLIDEPSRVTEAQMERWSKDFNSWAVCDGCCANLFDKTEWAHRKALEWSQRKEEFVKRGGFVLMAAMAVHDKKAANSQFLRFFPLIFREATDERNFVKKGVNWALRQIGKRNATLNKAAIRLARKIQKIDSRSARWIAADALRELTSRKVQERVSAATGRLG
ncbi:MAG: DNA alkylation repair protein [Terriglobia bacterium]